MPVVAVVNRKGGSGKTTLAVHLAAHCARLGDSVMLGDVDRQLSTQDWLRRREAQHLARRGAIIGRPLDARSIMRAPSGVSNVVLDTPGGLRGFELARVVMFADAIVMPVCNSAFDRDSAAECYAELLTHPRVASGRCKVAVVGMRVDSRTKAAEVLAQWAAQQKLPFIGALRETQGYVRCVELGLTLFDLQASKVEADMAQWEPILQWITPILLGVPQRAEDATRMPTQPGALAMVEPRKLFQEPPAGSTRPVQEAAASQLEAVARLQQGRPALAGSAVHRSGFAERLGALVGALPLPRFLQRHPQA